MTDRIDPGPGWRLLEIGEIRPAGYQYLYSEGLWSDGAMVGVIVAKSSGACRVRVNGLCRVRVAPTTIKAIATRATVLASFPDGAMIADSIACESGLSGEMMQFSADRWELSKIHLQTSGAKYIMLEIQREGEP